MNTSVNNSQGPAFQGNPGSGSGSPGSQISAGSAALVYEMINEIMALEAQILELDKEQKVNMVQAQNNAAKSQADATEASGITQAVMYGVMGGLSLVGLGIGLKVQADTLNSPQGEKVDADLTAANEKLNAFKDPEAVLLKANQSEVQNGGNGQPAVDEARQALIDQRATEIQDFKELQNNDLDKQALQKIKAENRDLYDAKMLQFNKDAEGPRMEVNSAVNAKSSMITTANSKKQIADTIFQSINSVTQSIGNGVKSTYDAITPMAQTSGQLTGSASGDYGQAMGKAIDAQQAQVQIWKDIVSASSRV